MKIIAINHAGGKPQRDKKEYETVEQAKISYGSKKFPAKLVLNKSVFILIHIENINFMVYLIKKSTLLL